MKIASCLIVSFKEIAIFCAVLHYFNKTAKIFFLQGQELASDGYNHEIITITEAGSLATSKLVIKKTQEGDFGKYQVHAYGVEVTFLRKPVNLNQELGNHFMASIPI